jgi:hypothetical protein
MLLEVDWTPAAKEHSAHRLLADRKSSRSLPITSIKHCKRSATEVPAGRLRKIVLPPLIAYYEIDHAKRTVEVTGVVLIVTMPMIL